MEEGITIYKTRWDDISLIRGFLNTHLLKYRVVPVSEEISAKPHVALPIVEIFGTYLYNPTLQELSKALGMMSEPVKDFYDLAIVGSGLEACFLLDYAIKEKLSAVCLKDPFISTIDEFQKAYGAILHLPNPFIEEYIVDFMPSRITLTQNKKYIELNAGDAIIYARGLVLALDQKPARFWVEGEENVMGEYLFFDIASFIAKSKEKRVRNARKRNFAIIGDNSKILLKALTLYDEIVQLDEHIQFELSIISPQDFMFGDRVLLKKVRAMPHVRVLGKTDVLSFSKQGFQVLVETDMLSYTFDRVLGYNQPEVQNRSIMELLPVGRDGFPETDHSGKTIFAQIYSTITEDHADPGDRRLELLDAYIACAGIIQQIKRYLDEH